MMFRCCECGHLFEEGEQAVWEETHGLDSQPYEKWSGCPVCKGDYEEVYNCEICGSVHTGDEIHGGVCDDCIGKYRYDIDMCFKVGAITKNEVKLNSFITAMFDEKEIEDALMQVLKERRKVLPVDCLPFIEAGEEEFGLGLPR